MRTVRRLYRVRHRANQTLWAEIRGCVIQVCAAVSHSNGELKFESLEEIPAGIVVILFACTRVQIAIRSPLRGSGLNPCTVSTNSQHVAVISCSLSAVSSSFI